MKRGAMKVLFVASEAFPLVKTGGLGDVLYSLPHALHDRGVDIRLVLPGYRALVAPARTGAHSRLVRRARCRGHRQRAHPGNAPSRFCLSPVGGRLPDAVRPRGQSLCQRQRPGLAGQCRAFHRVRTGGCAAGAGCAGTRLETGGGARARLADRPGGGFSGRPAGAPENRVHHSQPGLWRALLAR